MKDSSTDTTQVHGTVLGFNVSAKGKIVGVLLKTARGTAQLNFRKHDLRRSSMPIGSKVELTGDLEHHTGHHQVYGPGASARTVTGKVARLNYGRHGQVNGVHLDDGTFLHLDSRKAKKHRLHVGENVKATGVHHEGFDAVVLKVDELERLSAAAGKRRDGQTVGRARSRVEDSEPARERH